MTTAYHGRELKALLRTIHRVGYIVSAHDSSSVAAKSYCIMLLLHYCISKYIPES